MNIRCISVVLMGSVAVSSLLAPECVAASAATEMSMLEEITVTARKREENIQEVPESITFLSSATLVNAGVENVSDIVRLVPGVVMYDTFRAGVIQLVVRGITTPQNSEAPMSFVVDGVTAPEIDFINQGIYDVESVQVLRGPQGALYGRGALGGAIVINTKQPTNEFSGSVNASYESGQDYHLGGALSGPVIKDKLLFRVGGTYNDRRGQILSTAAQEYVDFVDDDYSVRGLLKFMASDALTISLRGKYSDGTLGGGRFDVVPIGQLNNVGDTVSYDFVATNDREIKEASAAIDWALDFADLAFISSYAHIEDTLLSDGDFRANPGFIQLNRSIIESYTQEFRLTSTGIHRFNWIVGGFHQKRDKRFTFSFLDAEPDGSVPPFVAGDQQDDFTSSKAYALYGHVGYDITDAIELSAALRYDRDHRTFATALDVTRDDERTWTQLQPKVSLSYTVFEGLMTYVGYSKGFRTGGFNETFFSIQPGAYEKEVSDSYELGFKASAFDNRMTINGSVYHIDLKNAQFGVFDANTFAIGNINLRDVTNNGFELEIMAKPTTGLTLTSSVSATESILKDYNGTGVFVDNTVPEIPAYTFNAGAEYIYPLSDTFEGLARIDFRQEGRTFWQVDNVLKTGSKSYLNARLGLQSDRWSLSGYVTNLLNTRQPLKASITGGGSEARFNPNLPRAWGVEARARF